MSDISSGPSSFFLFQWWNAFIIFFSLLTLGLFLFWMPANNTAKGRLQNQKIVDFWTWYQLGVTRVDIPNCLNRFWIREGFSGKKGQLAKKNNNNSLPIDAKTRTKVRVRFKMHEANFFNFPISPTHSVFRTRNLFKKIVC